MKLLCISLGCDKNLVDAERMLGSLSQDGYTFTDDEQEADVILVNTCCFINDAKEESVNTILEMAEYKKSGTCKALLVSGCMAQRYKEEILQEVPEVDGILGTTSYDEVSKVLAEALKGERVSDFHDLSELPETKMRSKRLVTTGGHYAFLKISEGCNKRCTYCIIPSLRGPYRSVPMEQLLAEAKELADQGVKELILVAQETTLYGVDLYGEKTLPKLLHELAQIDGIEWIRIQYCYPEEITEELIQAIKTEEKVCHYLDIPIQHASDAVLKRMGRRTNQAELRERIAHLREEIPDIALRTTLISGFPGETQEDHEELMRFVDEMEFDRLGVFAYSAEEDTPAAGYPDQVPQEVKEDRRDEIMELQQEIAFEKAGIIKKDVPALVGEIDRHSVAQVFADAAVKAGTLVYFAQDEGLLKESYLMDTGEWYLDSAEYGQLFGELGGVVQFRNATTVLGAINLLNTVGVNIPTEAVREGFEHVVELTGLMGRWQVLQENPKVVCDTGHNVGGWQYLNIQLEEELKRHKYLFMIVGMVNDKDIDGVLDLMPEKAFYFFTQASVQRAMPAEDFATKAIFHGLSGTICDSVQEAVEKALARAGQDDIIFIGGSTFVVAGAPTLFLKRDK